MNNISPKRGTEQWGVFELKLQGSTESNPFLEVEFKAQFSYKHRTIEVDGFYDGEDIYRVRFMPDTSGTWHYQTISNLESLNNKEGTFECFPAGPDNHGPVLVANIAHFAYADGTPYKQIGTTCYAWTHQGNQLEEQTLATLKTAPFNKLRMCVFPKHMDFNENEPQYYPFPCLSKGESKWAGTWNVENKGWAFDFSRFEPAFFQHFEQRVGDLLELGIQADIILLHPYDRWGFSDMDAHTDDRYLRYVVARLAAYRNVWWSMANEFDLMHQKSMADWDRFFRIVQESDPYQHLRSIHNCIKFYDHAKPWVTHLSIQTSHLALTRYWREQFQKPVVIDECRYEGNISEFWGNISGQEMVHRFWEATAYGGYAGHGDTFKDAEDVLWWAKGGILHGESAPRLAFLKRILDDSPAAGLDPLPGLIFDVPPYIGQEHQYYLVYFGNHQPSELKIKVPEGEQYRAEIIDTWEMTLTPLGYPVERDAVVSLPGKPYQALVLRRKG